MTSLYFYVLKIFFHYEIGKVLNQVTQKGTRVSVPSSNFLKIFNISEHRAILKYENRFLV